MAEEITHEQYEEIIRLQGVAGDRMAGSVTGPFLVEPFCAQVAWMGKLCPVYPWTADHPNHVCRFLTSSEYEGYRCPGVECHEDIFKLVYEAGTSEQRKALETLADMAIRDVQKPIDEEIEMWQELTGYRSAFDAIRIYERLGLDKKAENAWRVLKGSYSKRGIRLGRARVEESESV